MGLIVHNYTTEHEFLIPELYVHVTCIRMLRTFAGSDYGMVYTSTAYKSLSDKNSGASPIHLPNYLTNIEDFVTANRFYETTIFGLAYNAIKRTWQNAGYIITDHFTQEVNPNTFIYDASGYNYHGFNAAGYDKDGYDQNGFDINGFDREGYNQGGFNTQGYDREGYGTDSYNKDGIDRFGFNREGYGIDGYDVDGYNKDGVNRNGESRPLS